MSELIITSDLMLFKGNVDGHHHHHQRKKILCKESYHRGEERARKESLKSKQQIRQSYKSPKQQQYPHFFISSAVVLIITLYLLLKYFDCTNNLSLFSSSTHSAWSRDLLFWKQATETFGTPRSGRANKQSPPLRMQCSRTLFSHSRSLTCSQQTEPPPHFVLSLSLSLDGYILEGKEKESIQKRIQQHREKKLQRANAAGSISISLCRCCHRRFQHRKVPSPSQSAKSVPKEASLNYSNAPFLFFFFFSLTYFYLFLIRPTPTQQTHRHFLSLSLNRPRRRRTKFSRHMKLRWSSFH